MTDYISLALMYGGFTTLDKPYLENVLEHLPATEKLAFITPPPSVINAYFAEIYQKQSPQEATDYYFQMSQALDLMTEQPSFDERKPFIRLNLSGKSFGYAYITSENEESLIFGETEYPLNTDLLFEIAQIFPHYQVFVMANQIHMAKLNWGDKEIEDITPAGVMLSKVFKLSKQVISISGYNQEEVLSLAEHYQGQYYYQYKEREFKLFIHLDK
ncbi:cystathionine beta-lyase [Streptococcus parauberis]|uniref:Cystathionine beta-lyase n=3 Tax=Streptococcus parauberis TaxID=1348 RepID=A0A0E2UEW1_9STRE|nr:hypothetical protein [Streptococcus parauberis]AEF25432.1 hypothetical protein STP_0984 [Streptococcus parauberis KCTC 11537]AUT06375.1 hypothetical protein SPSF3K_01654 [Streptococcus parauberis]EGE54931.1 hypothetical protein SPB_0845 [Streptococcus parauberis NCFD 2020]EMG25616.1 hypothetical protein SPJ1_1027 [Streptococcus parauberis KRS-02083]MDT2731955.1 cystathionine beta-lyase [Streptococcus parauberis]